MSSRRTAGVFIAGGFFGLLLTSNLLPDEGRGSGISACPADYDGLIEVNDMAVLDELGQTAENLGIPDSDADKKSDIASLRGELACLAIVSHGTGEFVTVLLPEGMEALDRGGSVAAVPGESPLPEGLSWK